ncbi:MAG TPA: metalloregulator ArsR/SmtB family transcription factor [Fimbriimonas sp.]|nr:metalloregulator ArsR/SmtB family transcription factor [Fimbriimonas sp.]
MLLNSLFHALADTTRRDILNRVAEVELSISELAKPYSMSFAAIAKHISVLEKAQLIKKERRGKEQIISMAPQTVQLAEQHIAQYSRLWNERFDKLEGVLLNQQQTKP